MADFFGANHTLNFQSEPSEKSGVGDERGKQKHSFDSFTLSAELTTSDSLKLMKLPAGARVIELILKSEDMGTTGAFDIGWEASADGGEAADQNGFLSAVAVTSAAGDIHRLSDAVTPGLHKKFSEEVQVALVPTTNTDAGTGQDLSVSIEYVMD